ncbi:MAG: acetylornithine transaminase [Armatimonadota bacterium]|jgi:acetylornithine/N-succinyldiaminopimelate aminotransferase
MNNHEIAGLAREYLMPTYAPPEVAFVRGEGTMLVDADGNEYLDFVAGIAVCGVGHSHPRLARAICEQALTIMHTSNLYFIEPQARLAEKLAAISFAERSFFCNSGAEANEAAIKLARKWALENLTAKQRTIITAEKSFHGRTLTTVTATGQEKYQKAFAPLPSGFRYVPFGDIEALERAADDTVCAVMLEPIQGEGGINVPGERYLSGVRRFCDERGLLLILDEVQTGIGRTGEWFGYQHFGIEPDIMTLAKSLGGGFPIGACVAAGDVATVFQPGDHASTFGGNHLACTAALETLAIIEDEGLVENAATMGGLLIDRFGRLAAKMEAIDHIRGRGLLLGLQLTKPLARELAATCFERGLVLNAIGTDLLRLAPPLTVSAEECERAVDLVAEVLGEIS